MISDHIAWPFVFFTLILLLPIDVSFDKLESLLVVIRTIGLPEIKTAFFGDKLVSMSNMPLYRVC